MVGLSATTTQKRPRCISGLAASDEARAMARAAVQSVHQAACCPFSLPSSYNNRNTKFEKRRRTIYANREKWNDEGTIDEKLFWQKAAGAGRAEGARRPGRKHKKPPGAGRDAERAVSTALLRASIERSRYERTSKSAKKKRGPRAGGGLRQKNHIITMRKQSRRSGGVKLGGRKEGRVKRRNGVRSGVEWRAGKGKGVVFDRALGM